MPVIKRYPNRKLYDTEAKRYVTLDHITKMVRDGQDVRVIDHETGEDLTSLTLSQIILEQEKKQTGFLPRSLLTSLIRTGGETVESLVRSVQGTLPLAKPTLLEQKLKQLVDAGQLTSEQAAAVLKALQPTEILDENLTHFLHRLNIPTNQDVRILQQQLAELTDKLAELLQEVPDASASTDDSSSPDDVSPPKQVSG